ncbi:MAG: FHA domain-containing protein [Akkermansia sp.]|nr:FHA domain-containing protein [Akkermansia sp.]
MNSAAQEQNQAKLEELEAQATELESQLSGVRQEIAGLHAIMHEGQAPATGQDVPLAPAWDAPLAISMPPTQQQIEDENVDAGQVYPQSLQPYHALRAKWGLGSGLENALTPDIVIPDLGEEEDVATDLRLFGLLTDGRAWEQRIPFDDIAQDNGVTLGRDPGAVNYAVDDASISRSHVQLRLDEYGLIVSDLGSTNGTAVNGVALTAYDNSRPLQDGDTLTIGCVDFQVEFI